MKNRRSSLSQERDGCVPTACLEPSFQNSLGRRNRAGHRRVAADRSEPVTRSENRHRRVWVYSVEKLDRAARPASAQLQGAGRTRHTDAFQRHAEAIGRDLDRGSSRGTQTDSPTAHRLELLQWRRETRVFQQNRSKREDQCSLRRHVSRSLSMRSPSTPRSSGPSPIAATRSPPVTCFRPSGLEVADANVGRGDLRRVTRKGTVYVSSRPQGDMAFASTRCERLPAAGPTSSSVAA